MASSTDRGYGTEAGESLICCTGDPLSWCPACDRTVGEPLMVWADIDLYICFECAGVERPWHDWGASRVVRH